MSSKYGNAPARRAAWVVALAAVVAVAGSGRVFAQATSGSIYGQVEPGSVITVKSQETSLTRSITVGQDGQFNFTNLPTGTYDVTKTLNGSQTGSEAARVNPGVGTAVVFGAAEVQEVVVTGTAIHQIDTKTAEVSTTFSTAQLSEIPITPDVLDIALLAPGVTRGTSGANEQGSPLDESYSQAASFGGASIAENQYYLDGFNITNLFRNLQYAQVPYYSIETEQVTTGGYGPEYGLSTGGVVSITTKKGTNDWKFGGAATWEPNALRAKEGPNSYNSDGSVYRGFADNTDSLQKYDLWAGGPIVKDRLFIFVNFEFTKEDSWAYPVSYPSADRNVWDQDNKSPFGLVKLDWNINDRNILEFTGVSNQTRYSTGEYSAAYDASGLVVQGPFAGTDIVHRGGWIAIGKYIGYITDDLTVSALYGQLGSKRSEQQVSPDGTVISYNGTVGDFNQPGCPYVTYSASYTGVAKPSCYVTSEIGAATGEDTRKSGRADVEYKLPIPLLGKHTFKAGYDFDRWNSFFGESYAGGTFYTYYQDALYAGPYVRVRHFQTGADAGVHSSAFYLKDDWQVTKDFLIQVGVRNDSFKNLNGDGEVFLTQDNIWQPRIGFAWDMLGDSRSKLYGSYGIYSLPVTAGVSIRGASASIYNYQYFQYTGIDPTTGAPVTLGAPLSGVNYYNGENGVVPPAGTFAATNLAPTKQEEFIIGFQQDLGQGWKGGVRATYRNLLKTIDDYCDPTGFDNWAARTGWENGTANVDANYPCFVINPGYGANINYDVDGDGKLDSVHLSAGDIGLPKAIRKYLGLEFTIEKVQTDKWYLQASYTWAHNYGNAEGLADSDLSQLDIGTTEEFDFPAIMEGAYGNLPNDHRNTFKGLVAYKVIPDLTVSSNLSVQTGKPISCIGYDAASDANFGYGAAYHYCGGHIVPRGSVGTTNTIVDIDLGVTYQPSYVPGLALSASLFNLFDKHGVTNVDEFGEDSQGTPQASYLSGYSYQPPRYVQLNVRYEFDAAKK